MERSPAAGVSQATVLAELARLRPQRPRILARAEDFERLQAKLDVDAHLRSWRDQLRLEADKILARPVSEYSIPDGLRLLHVSREVGERVYVLALLYRLDADDCYRARLWQELQAVAAFPDWNPRHYLDTAGMAHAFGIAYDWLHDDWSQAQRETIRSAIRRHAFATALPYYRGEGHGYQWHQTTNNWNLVCNGGLAIAALALADTDAEVAAEIIAAGIRNVPRSMAFFEPDGGCYEGPGYWAYGMGYLVYHLAALQSAFGHDFGLGTAPILRTTGLFPVTMTGSTGAVFNFADGWERPVFTPALFWLARHYQQPLCAWWQRRTPRARPLDLLWGSQVEEASPDPRLPRVWRFRGIEAISLRTAWNDADAGFVGVQCGSNPVGHNQLDLGSFVYEALGERWIVELPPENYNLPRFFGLHRYAYYRNRAEGHNTLVIGPDADPDQDPEAGGRVVTVQDGSDGGAMGATMDLTAAYPKATHVERTIALQPDGALEIVDEVACDGPRDLHWFAHTRAAGTVAEDGHSAVLTQNGKTIEVELIDPPAARIRFIDARPLPTSPDPEGQNPNDGSLGPRDSGVLVPVKGEPGMLPMQAARKLAIHLPDIDRTTLRVRFKPRKDAP